MILAKLNKPNFEYDIHSLIKAFYPEEYVSATAEERTYEEPVTSEMTIDYLEKSICIHWEDKKLHREFEVDFSDRKENPIQ